MTFTYTEDLTNDRDWVRFKTGDTVSDKSFLSDEIIASLLATEESRKHAVLAAVGYIITQLSNPDFKADWLEVDNSKARAAWEKTLARLEDELGVTLVVTNGGVSGRSVKTYRGDSATAIEPDYTGGRPGKNRPDAIPAGEYIRRRRWEQE